MNNCHLGDFPVVALNKFLHLTRLYLRNNSFTTLPNGAFSSLTRLHRIDLSDNHLVSLPDGLFQGLEHSLQSIYVNNAKLQNFQPAVFHNLTRLQGIRMDDNVIEQLPDEIFTSFATHSHSFVLSLGHNHISHVPTTSFVQSNISLSYLCLEGNQIVNLLFLSEPCNSSFGYMARIDVKHNPLACDCMTYAVAASDNYLIEGECADTGPHAGHTFGMVEGEPFLKSVEEECRDEPQLRTCQKHLAVHGASFNRASQTHQYNNYMYVIFVHMLGIYCIIH